MARYHWFTLLRAIIFGLFYTVLEVNIPINYYIPDLDYRILYFALFFFANLTPSWALTFANFFVSMTAEDLFYWLVKDQLPFQYAWYYPVIDHVPLVDVIEIAIAIPLYYFSPEIASFKLNWRSPLNTTYPVGCGNWQAFLHGKMHDEYALLVIISVSLVGVVLADSVLLRVVFSLFLICAVGVFVDLWAHCFQH